MEKLKEIVTIFSAFIVSSSLIFLLIPSGKIKKTTISAITVLMIAAIVLLGGNIDLNLPRFDADIEENNTVIDEYVINSTKEIFRKRIDEILREICEKDYKIELIVKTLDYSVILENIHITVDKSDYGKALIIRNKISNELSVIPEVSVNE